MSTEIVNAATQTIIDAGQSMVTAVEGSKSSFKVDGALYANTLPEGVTMAVVDSIDKHRESYVAAVNYLGGHKALDAFAADDKLEQASIEAPMGRDTVKVNIARRKTGTIQLGEKKGTPWEAYCVGTTTIKSRASSKGGQLGRVLGHLKTIGAERLAK